MTHRHKVFVDDLSLLLEVNQLFFLDRFNNFESFKIFIPFFWIQIVPLIWASPVVRIFDQLLFLILKVIIWKLFHHASGSVVMGTAALIGWA